MIHRIAAFVAEKEGLEDWSSSFILNPFQGGGSASTRKFILSLKAKNISSKFLIKVSTTQKLSQVVAQEAMVLDSLAELAIPGIPELILHANINGRYFLVQRFVNGVKIKKSGLSLESAIPIVENWLQNLYRKTRDGEIEVDELIKRADGQVAKISEFHNVTDALSIMDRSQPRVTIPTSLIHGDLNHLNVIRGDGIWIVDFGLCSRREPPLDILDLIASYDPGVLTSKRKLDSFSSKVLPRDVNPLFLALYALIRGTALEIESKRSRFQELLFPNLEERILRMSVAKILHNVIKSYG